MARSYQVRGGLTLLSFIFGLLFFSGTATAATWSASFPVTGQTCSQGSHELNAKGLPKVLDPDSSSISRYKVFNAACGDSTIEGGAIRLMCSSYSTNSYLTNIEEKTDGIGTISITAATNGKWRYSSVQPHTPATVQISPDGRRWEDVGSFHPYGAINLGDLKYREFRFEVNDPNMRYFRIGRWRGVPNWPCQSFLSITDLKVTTPAKKKSGTVTDEYVYVVDGMRGQIKKFDTEGNLLLKWGRLDRSWTARGGVFRPDSLIGLHGIAVDSKGHVYVVDGGHGKIHKFDGDGKFLNFVGGEEVCSLRGGRWYRGRIVGAKKVCSRDFPRTSGAGGISGIAIDSTDNLYIAVKVRHEIQKIDPEGNFVLKFGKYSSSQDWGTKPPGGYFRHSGNMRSLGGIAIDSQDNVFVVDGADGRIQKFNSSGQFLREITGPQSCRRNRRWESAEFCGAGFARDTSPGMQGIAIDSQDNLYLAEGASHQILKFDSDHYLVKKWGGQGCGRGQFQRGGSGVSGVAIDQEDNVYVATSGGSCNKHQIQKFDQDGKVIKDWNGLIGYQIGYGGLQGIAVGGVSSSSSKDSEEGECTGEEESKDYFVYVADTHNHRIQKFDAEGNFVLQWGNIGRYGSHSRSYSYGKKPPGGLFFYPHDVAADNKGNVYVADTANNRIQKFDANGTFITHWGRGDLNYPTGVGVDPEGNVWVADYSSQLVRKYDSNGKLLLTWPPGKTYSRARSWIQTEAGRWRPMFLHPRDVAIDKTGNVYVLEFDRGRVQKLDSSGKMLTIFGSRTSIYPDTICWRRAGCWNSAPGRFGMPRRIAIDNAGNVLVTDGHRIQKFSPAGKLLQKIGRGGGYWSRSTRNGEFNGPTGIAVGPDGKIFVVEEENNRVQVFDEEEAYLKKWGSSGRGNSRFQAPAGLAIGSGGGGSSKPPFITPNCEEDVTGSGAPVTTDARGSGGGTTLYLTQYSARDWTGDLKSYEIKGGGQICEEEDCPPPVWSAAAGLDSGGVSESTRVLLTWGKPNAKAEDPKTDSDGVAFHWDNLWATQQSDLRIENDGSCGTVDTAEDRLDYLRGDESEKSLRERKSLLGAIVHSRAIYVGDPILDWPGAGYAAFKAKHQRREPVIYVGANDGALHGFRAKDGKEVIGYFPASLFDTGSGSGLHYFTSDDYQHSYYVDGTPAVSDAFIKTHAIGSPRWHTVLVSTLRGGGRGLFAVDVTNPALFTEANARSLVLWEFNSSHDPHLGYTFSEPTIAHLNNGRWAAIIGNGYEDTADDKTGGQAQLFILYLDGGVDGTWTEGKDYLRLTTGTGSTSERNGLGTPAVVDLNGDGMVDRVYAGDLAGKLWAFDLTDKVQANWAVAHGSKTGPKPLFEATAATGKAQPITVEPIIMRQLGAGGGPRPNLMVFFGTGKYILEEDKGNTDPQSFYGVWDRGDSNLTRKNLAKQKILVETVRPQGKGRVLEPDLTVDYAGANGSIEYGWYLDLPEKGERVVSDAKSRGQIVHFNSIIPDPEDCAFGGSGWMMSVAAHNGGSPQKDSPAFDFDEDGAITMAGDTVEFHKKRYAYAGKKFEGDKGEPTGPTIVATGGQHLRYTAGTKTDEGDEVEAQMLEKLKGLAGRLSWQQMYPEIFLP